MATNLIFIVEDDKWYGEMLEYHLKLNPEYEIVRFTNGKDCLANLHRKPFVVTLDYTLPDMTGGDILKKIKQYNQDIPVVIISAQEDISTAVGLLREGAYDYFLKDNDTKDRLWNSILKIKENVELKGEIEHLREEVVKKYDVSKLIVGKCNPIEKIFSMIEMAAKTNIIVSVTGETGTGKELVAKAIHYSSDRRKKPFVAVNMAAIPKDLLESELFGYEKGAFTGANARKPGKFEEANNGTIFLDEIAEMDLSLQPKLLRVLQERELTRVGGNDLVKLDVRVITATNRDLSEEIHKNTFREDLYYRLLGLPINLPPLRDRGNDILILAKHFTDEFCKENKLNKFNFSEEAKLKLMNYKYPGNVRELKAVIELAVVMSSGNQLEENDITFNTGAKVTDFLSREMTMEEYSRLIIKSYLEKYDNNILLVAQKLDIGKSTLYRMRQNNEI